MKYWKKLIIKILSDIFVIILKLWDSYDISTYQTLNCVFSKKKKKFIDMFFQFWKYSIKKESFFFFETKNLANNGIDTQFCTHNLIKENDLNDQSMYPKNHNCITCINLFLHYMHQFVLALHASFCLCITWIISFIEYYKNDLEILMVTAVFSAIKSDYRIERYRIIKFARSTCIMSR